MCISVIIYMLKCCLTFVLFFFMFPIYTLRHGLKIFFFLLLRQYFLIYMYISYASTCNIYMTCRHIASGCARSGEGGGSGWPSTYSHSEHFFLNSHIKNLIIIELTLSSLFWEVKKQRVKLKLQVYFKIFGGSFFFFLLVKIFG